MSERYTIGLDYGTLSVRALLVNISDGKEVACAVYEYPHGVMDKWRWSIRRTTLTEPYIQSNR